MAMASVEIVCSECGKVFYWEKRCKNSKEAARTEEWAKRTFTTCPQCEERIAVAAAAARLDAVIAATGIKVPALTGSEKQIAWATSIRTDHILGMETRFGACTAKSRGSKSMREELEARLAEHTDAKWWIEHRDRL